MPAIEASKEVLAKRGRDRLKPDGPREAHRRPVESHAPARNKWYLNREHVRSEQPDPVAVDDLLYLGPVEMIAELPHVREDRDVDTESAARVTSPLVMIG